MTQDVDKVSFETELAEVKELFGPPPVLSTESAQAYDRMLIALIGWLKPQDFLEKSEIQHLMCLTWEITRLIRQKALLFDRKFSELQQNQAKRARFLAKRNEVLARARAQEAGKPVTESDRAFELEDVGMMAPSSVDEILKEIPDELGHARALEHGIDYYEKLDKLLGTALARRDNVLKQLGEYRACLGSALRKATDKIIESETASIVPDGVSGQ